ncbi:MAG: cyclic nucleotide-binding domain-containing protein [Gammaproteobacteria bacterium]|nr:cyclic nucleotide-binding domain-containing protein [Gammaproteobacteria bacterium]
MKFQYIANFSTLDLSINEKADLLDSTIWSNDFTWKDIKFIAEYFEVFHLPPNTVILKEGNKKSPFMGLIAKGNVLIIKEDKKNRHKLLAKIPEGKTFGEMSIIDNLPSSASVITETAVDLLVIDGHRFDDLMDDNPHIANKLLFKLLRLFSARLRETSGKLVDFLEKE